MPTINGRHVETHNVMSPAQLKKAIKGAKNVNVIELSPDSFNIVAIPYKGMYHVVLLNNAGTHVRTHHQTMALKEFTDMLDNVYEVAGKTSVFWRSQTKLIRNQVKQRLWGTT